MKLFDTFEAVKFPEEDMIFITRGGYLYYIYNPKYKWWRKHSKQIIVIEIIFVLMFLTRMQIYSCKSLFYARSRLVPAPFLILRKNQPCGTP